MKVPMALVLISLAVFAACGVGLSDPTDPDDDPFGLDHFTRLKGTVSTGSGSTRKAIAGAQVSASRGDTVTTTTNAGGLFDLYMGRLGSVSPHDCDEIIIRVAAEGYETVHGTLADFAECFPPTPDVWVSFELEPSAGSGSASSRTSRRAASWCLRGPPR